ncbi:MAG: kinase/pyrophosphorylase [Roseibium sp.]|uniref:pyruvate, water dikinase regulatory protein n=1 Tax=Roseibium sp. TaxID=1936156 RepID=UPI001B0AE33E|nr:pyruvate, water dikinase regulatory protein [Roseibium sp.]MBO6507208.1 kinase/pyrophosphorylase [Roseibium sp.]MBO6894445.1 kinase/pyrophosphorylase [Roseibium sp.]MBO6929630.1 kinase/pyrophosphorylase [Roseibium sp.]
MNKSRHYFHLHLVSDSTGETLMTVARAATVQYENVQEIEHVYPLVRSQKQLDRVISEIEKAPGIVLYTIVDEELGTRLEQKCRELGVPFVNILDPVFAVFQSYLNVAHAHRVGGQHELDAEYFQRMEALNYTMMHDDGQIWDDLDSADIVLLGISRTSKTPTCIYLANRGIKAANVPLVPGIPLPDHVKKLDKPMIVGLIASVERIQQIRKNRVLSINSDGYTDTYVDRKEISQEINMTRRLCTEHGWPLIDVSRRSVEETAAEILTLFKDYKSEREDRPEN